jgi:pimeloyl-ACP methyl ester carboxylesterase
LLSTKVNPGNYPGDMTPSNNWPGVAPGSQGVNNALAPKYMNQADFANIDPKVPVLWLRGANDQLVSDTSFFDFGFLGQIGAVPDWPGAEVYPPQPMVTQVRTVLSLYQANGGQYREVVLPDCGHSPHIEKPGEMLKLFTEFVDAH